MCSSSTRSCGSMTGGVTPGTSAIASRICSASCCKLVEVVAVDLDGDLGGDAGEHVADQVGQRLLGLDVDAGHRPPASRPATSCRNSSRRWPASGFMVRMYSPTLTGSACSSSSARPVRRTKCRIGPSGLSVDLLHRVELGVDQRRRPRSTPSATSPAGSATLTCTLPSSNCGRKSAPSRVSCQALKPTSTQVSRSSDARPPHAEADQEACAPLQRAQQQPVAVAVRRLRLRQQVVGQHRRHGQRHQQRRQDRHDVGHASGANSRPSTPDRANSGRKTRITTAVPNTMALRISRLAS